MAINIIQYWNITILFRAVQAHAVMTHFLKRPEMHNHCFGVFRTKKII